MFSDRIKKTLSYVLAFLFSVPMIFASAPDASAAREPELYVVESGTGGLYSMTRVEDYSGKNFYPFGDVKIEYGTLGGYSAVTAKKGTGAESSFYGVFENGLDLSSYSEIAFSFRVNGAAGAVSYVAFSLSSGADMISLGATFSAGVTYDVYFPIESFASRGWTDHLYCTFSSGEGVESITLSSIWADSKYTYSHINLFSADDFETNTEIELAEDAIYPVPKDGSCYIEADKKKPGGEGQTVVARIALGGVKSGTMTLSVSSGGKEFSDISAFNLFPGENIYTYIYDVSKGDASYKLTFTGIESAEDERFAVNGVSFSYYKDALGEDTESYPGTITGCTVSSDGRTVRVKGSLSSSAVVSHINGKIGIYAYDMWNTSEAKLVAEADMSTLFDLSTQTASLGAPAVFCRYFAALIGDDGAPEEAFTSSVYPTASGASPSPSQSVFGVMSADTSAAFIANAKFTVVDVFVDELVGDDPSGGRFRAFAGENFYLNASELAYIESTLGFFVKSGMNVYVRLLMNSDGKNSVYASLDTNSRKDVMRYSAAVDYLSEKYPSIYGFIVGKRINSRIYNSGAAGLFDYAKNYVRALRITSSVARMNIPGAVVAVPIGDSYVYPDGSLAGKGGYDEMTGVGENEIDPMLLSALISRFMPSGSAFPWYLAYECESDPAGSAEQVSRYAARLIQNVGASPNGNMVIWDPDHNVTEDELTSLSEKMTSDVSTLGTKSLIVCLDGDVAEGDAAMRLRELDFEQQGIRKVNRYDASEGDLSFGGVMIKDFRGAYGVGEFFSGGAIVSLTTEQRSAPDGRTERALRADGVAGKGCGGVIMTRFASPVGIGSADSLDVVICVTSASGGDVPVTVIIGDGTERCEYTLTVGSGVLTDVRCRLYKETLEEAEHFAIVTGSSEDVTLDVSTISLSRDDGDNDAIKEALGKKETKSDGDRGTVTLGVMIGLTVISVVLFALVSFRGDRRKIDAETKKTKK